MDVEAALRTFLMASGLDRSLLRSVVVMGRVRHKRNHHARRSRFQSVHRSKVLTCAQMCRARCGRVLVRWTMTSGTIM